MFLRKKISYANIMASVKQGHMDEVAVTPDIRLHWKHRSKQQNASRSGNLHNGIKVVKFNWPDTCLSSEVLHGGFDSSTPDSGNINFDLCTSNDVSPVTPLPNLSEVKSFVDQRSNRQSVGARRLPRSKAQVFVSSPGFNTYQNNEMSCDAAKVDSGIMCSSGHSLSSTSADEDSILMLSGRSGQCILPANKILGLENEIPKLDFEDSDSLEVIIKPSLMASVDKLNEIRGTHATQVSIGKSDCEVMNVILGEQDPSDFNQSVTKKTRAPAMRPRKSAFSDVEPSDSSDLDNEPPVTDDVELFSDLLTDDGITSSTMKYPAKNIRKGHDYPTKNKRGHEYLDDLKNDEGKQRIIGTKIKRSKNAADCYESNSDYSCGKQDIFDYGDIATVTNDVDVSDSWNKKKEKVYRHEKDGGLIEWSGKCKISDGERDQRGGKTYSDDKKTTSERVGSLRVHKQKSAESSNSLRVHDGQKSAERVGSLRVHDKQKSVGSGSSLRVHGGQKSAERVGSLRVHDKQKSVESGSSLRVRDRLVNARSENHLRMHVNEKTGESGRSLRVHSRQKSAGSESCLGVKVSAESGTSLRLQAKGKTSGSGSSLRIHKRRKTAESDKSRDVPGTEKKGDVKCHSLTVAKKRSCDETKGNEIYVTVESFLTSLQPKRKMKKLDSRGSPKNPEKFLDIFEGETQTEVEKMKEIDDIANNYELIIE